VEFLVAFLPFLIFFLCLWQVSILYYTKLFVDHAAFAAARGAAVIMAESSNRVNDTAASTVNSLTSVRKQLARNAIEIVLAPLILDGTIASFSVAYPKPNDPGGKDSPLNQTYSTMTTGPPPMMRVRVTARMACRIAFANLIMCPNLLSQLGVGKVATQPTIAVVSEAIFPFQGASYTYDPNDN
jgi:Flp pilus assembly protein TadG